ncbi:hypothetical protein [Mycobacteroides franklinii]|uniref:Uncharacterized protein n=1 Tax=Mycobacteroides franklinii TaxID=948102 RepID=A0A4R5P8E8_9MYCO|nr:hypothetical protein [Mycobacteroides franklinii]ORA58389.1 hypothetical protein BST24_21405 [Mycobacteroides franklinii]TDH20127.1 hypothetical protein EJ571_15110 [Mycobacteroides franklinii]
MSTADARVHDSLALVTRTEYVSGLARARVPLGAVLLVAALVLLPVLALAGVDALVVVLVVGGLLSGSFAVAALGPLVQRRSAVRLGVVDGQILIGTEDSKDVVRPLNELVDVALSLDQSPDTRVSPVDCDLRIRGIRYLQLTFDDGLAYHVALLETDPVAAEIRRRLERAQPKAQSASTDSKPSEQQRTRTERPPKPVKPRHTAETEDRELITPAASPAADIRLWEAARVAHRRVLSEYGAYELEPERYLRYPGVTDIGRVPVMDFHSALGEAQALATDEYPNDAAYAGRYRAAVEALRRAWVRCERDGKAAGTSYLDGDDQADLCTAAKLYTHAHATDHPGEKHSYLRKVQQILVDLDERGCVQLPRPMTAAIEAQALLALEPGTR